MSTTRDSSEHKLRLYEVFIDDHGLASYVSGFNQYHEARSRTVGDNIQDWKFLLANGLNATTGFGGVEQRIEFGKREVEYTTEDLNSNDQVTGSYRRRQTEYPLHTIFGGGAPENLPSADTFAKALGKFNQKTHGVATKFSGGVFLGELRETIHAIRHPADALASSFQSYFRVAKKLRRTVIRDARHYGSIQHRRVRNSIKNANSALAGTWLEYSFGLMPLIHDINDAMKAASDRYSTKPPFEYVTAKASDKALVFSDTSIGIEGPVSWVEFTDVISQVDVTFRGVVNVVQNLPSVDQNLWGFGLRDFVPTLWEVTPYSWLVDYATNIGDVINGLSYGGFGVRWTNFTVRKLYETRNWATLAAVAGPIPGIKRHHARFFGGLTRSTKKVTSRATYLGSYVPAVTFTVPTSTRKLSNMVAVATQLVGRFL